MPLYLIAECCKCKASISLDIWSIKRDNGYSRERYVCEHFDVNIYHESSIGFFGIGWRNKIKVTAYYKPRGVSKNIIERTFEKGDTEFQDYQVFSNEAVFHARISDDYGNYPTIGNNRQNDIEYNEARERQRREQEKRERKRREEQQRQLQRECDLQLSRLIEKEKEEEEERKNDLKLLEEKLKRTKKTTSRRRRHIIRLDVDGIFDLERRRQICKSGR